MKDKFLRFNQPYRHADISGNGGIASCLQLYTKEKFPNIHGVFVKVNDSTDLPRLCFYLNVMFGMGCEVFNSVISTKQILG